MVAVSVLELRPSHVRAKLATKRSGLHGRSDAERKLLRSAPSFRSRMLPYLKVLHPPAARRYEVALSVRKQLDRCVAMFSGADGIYTGRPERCH